MYSLSFSSSYNNNNNNNSDINSNINSNNRSIIPYISVGFYISLCAFTLNVISDTHLSRENTNPAIKTVP